MAHRSNTTALAKRWTASLAAIPVFAVLVADPQMRAFALVNAAAQLGLFALVAGVPGWRTKRMTYVDIAWPWGLVTLGVLTLALGEREQVALIVAAIYLVMGLRMGLGAVAYWRSGEFDHELPRYRYQRLRWETATLGDERRDVVAEVLVQAWANCTTLAVPAALAIGASDGSPGVTVVAAVLLWVVAWLLESVADVQKRLFIARPRSGGVAGCCDVGLWGYSRHPNYFFQWMQWNALALISVPALLDRFASGSLVVSLGLAWGLVGVSATMLWCLVYYTGAVPAEYYSAKKRPAYLDYQARVSRFVPRPPREPAAVPPSHTGA